MSLCRISLVLCVAAGLCGCGNGGTSAATRPAETTPTQPATAKAPEPDVPIDLDQDALVSKVLITDNTVAQRHLKEKYKQDPKAEFGNLIGVCYVPAEKAVPVLAYLPVDVSGIKEPEKGEPEYYAKYPPRKNHQISAWDQRMKRFGIGGAVMVLRGAETGKRSPLNRPSYVLDVNTAQFRIPSSGYNYGTGNVCFGPMFERVQFCNTEFFPADLRVKRLGPGFGGSSAGPEVFFSQRLPGYSDPKFPGERYGSNTAMKPLTMHQTPPVLKDGRYEITDERHPWVKAHLFVVDNPYVCASRGDGMFDMKEVPVGKYTIEVWHPDYAPVKASHEVDIAAYKTAELPIEFKTPELLTSPPAAPTGKISTWDFLGLFPRGELKYKAEALDFNARYEDQNARQVGWKQAAARPDGYVYFQEAAGDKKPGNTVGLAYATLTSPKEQAVVLGVAADDYVWMWVNGAEVATHERWGGALVPVRLKAGTNTLLLKVENHGGQGRFAVSYGGEGVAPGPLPK